MPLTTCPNFNDEHHNLLKEIYGKGKALAALSLIDNRITTPEQAIKLLHGDKIQIEDNLKAWYMPEEGGKPQKSREPFIDELIKRDPDAPVGGGESYNQVKDRSIDTGRKLLNSLPDKGKVVTSSSVLKFIMEWDKMGRPTDLSELTPERYLGIQTTPGEEVVLKGTKGDITFIRHAMTEDGEELKIRSDDTLLSDKGHTEAERLSKQYSKDDIPVMVTSPMYRHLQTADHILSNQPTGEKYSDTQLAESKRYTVPEDITDFWDKYTAISRKKAELEQQGAQITNLGEKGFNYVIPDRQQGIYKQRTEEQNHIKHELQSIISGTVETRHPEDKIEKTSILLKRLQGDGKQEQTGTPTVERVWEDIRQAGLDFKGVLTDKIEEGGEHYVYRGEKEGTVIKLRHDIESVEGLTGYLKLLRIHNTLFPEAEYRLLGFRYGKEKLYPVVEQDYIRSNSNYDADAIDAVMASLGFRKVKGGTFKSPETGVVVTDLNPKNVYFEDSIPHFIDPMIYVEKPDEGYKQQTDEEKYLRREPFQGQINSDKGTVGERDRKDALDKTVQAFLTNIGVDVQRLRDQGQDFVAMADTIRGVIQVVDGKADISTLPEEAAHMFVDLLPDGKLLSSILSDAFKSSKWDDVYAQYKGDKQYQLADGEVDEDKITRETAGKLIAQAMVGRFETKQAQKWWQKLWDWVKGVFGGKNLDNFGTIAEDILSGNTKKLSKEKIAAMNKAAKRGEIYYSKEDHLSDDAKNYIDKVIESKGTTDVQKALIKALYIKDGGYEKIAEHLGVQPHIPLMLVKEENGEAVHKHIDINGEVYESVTSHIKGKMSDADQAKLQLQADWGTNFHNILEGLVLDKKVEDIGTPLLSDEVKRSVYKTLGAFIEAQKGEGYIALPEVEVADPKSKVAGSIDLLLLSPDGFAKIVDLKTAVRAAIEKGKLTPEYGKSTWPMEEGSVFRGSEMELSKEQQHAIQVGAYAKMLELQGVPVTALHTLHLNLKTEGQEITGYKSEGLVSHPVEDNQPYIDMVVPTAIDEQNPSALQMKRPGYDYSDIDPANPYNNDTRDEQTKEADAAMMDKMEVLKPVIDKAIDIVNQRVEWVKDLNRSKPGAEIKNSTIDTLTQLRRSLMKNVDSAEYKQALDQFMKFTREQTQASLDYIQDTDNYTNKQKDNYPRVLVQASKFLEGYQNVYKLIDRKSGSKIESYGKTLGMLSELQLAIREGLQGYFSHYFREKLDIGTIPDDTIQQWIYGMSPDITMGTYMADAPHGTRDIAISMMDKELRDAIFRGNEDTGKTHQKIQETHQKLLDALGQKKFQKGQFDFMTNKDGTYVQRTGKQYWNKVQEARALTIDEGGNKLQYKEGKTPEVIAYNKDLYAKNEAYRKLTRAEIYNKDKQDYDEGDYQRYTQTFIEARKHYEVQNAYGRWVPKHPDSVDYRAYKERYYTVIPDVHDTSTSFDKKGEFTGVVGERSNIYVVNPIYKEVKSYRTNEQGKNVEELRDEKYLKMLNDTSTQGKAKMQFYQDWMGIMDSYHGKLPLHVVNQLKGKMPVKEATLLKRVADSGLSGALGVLGKATRDEFAYGTYHGERMVDEAGNFKQSIPIGYHGSLKDQGRIQELTDKLASLDAGKPDNSAKKEERRVYREQRALLKSQLEAEKGKLTPDEIEENIVKGFMDFTKQAEKYIQLDSIEDKVLGIRELIRQKTEDKGYYKRDAVGRTIYKKGTTEPLAETDTYADKMAQNLVDTVLYSSGERDNSFMSMVADKMVKYTGIKVFALNPLTSASVWSMGSFNLFRSAIGGQHFGMKSFAKALGEYYGKAMPSYAKGKVSQVSGGEPPKYQSKFEAFVAKYQVPVKMFVGDKGMFHYLTIAEHGTEYFIQSVPAVATAMHKDISGKAPDGSDMTKKLYDTWDYDPVSGELTPVKGFEHVAGDKELTKWHGYFQDVNNMEHGPFAAMEQNTMNRVWIGKLLNMFHRVLWPAFKSRLAAPYTHQNFGESEGSYVTAVNFIKDMRTYEGSIWEKLNNGWHDLSTNEKANIRKVLFDITTFAVGFAAVQAVKSIASSVSDDDKNLKRWVNFMQKTTERVLDSQLMYIPGVGAEQEWQLIKSPIAPLGTMADFASALSETLKLPFPPYEDHYYTNGIHAGELKSLDKLKKALPGTSVLRQWDDMTSGHYFHQ